jgi:hypothetical protein
MIKAINPQIEYLLKITDNIGLIEHSRLDKPNLEEGYCVDDNARAIQVCLRLEKDYPKLKKFLPVYVDFLISAMKDDDFYNDLNQDLTWKKNHEKYGEHYGRAVAAIGELGDKKLFEKLYSRKIDSQYLRVWAQIIWGLRYQKSWEIEYWAKKIIKKYELAKNDQWKWYEPVLSYDVGRIPMGLLVAYEATNKREYLETAKESIDFLTENIFNKKGDYFSFPGNKGWCNKNGKRAVFAQQSIEAGSATEMCCLAFKISGEKKYRDLAKKAFEWYSGRNILGMSLINPKTGGIYDGLEENGINLNQGAEAVLSYLLGWAAIIDF